MNAETLAAEAEVATDAGTEETTETDVPSVATILDSLELDASIRQKVEKILADTDRKFFDRSFQRWGEYNDGNGFPRSARISNRQNGLIRLGVAAEIAAILLNHPKSQPTTV